MKGNRDVVKPMEIVEDSYKHNKAEMNNGKIKIR